MTRDTPAETCLQVSTGPSLKLSTAIGFEASLGVLGLCFGWLGLNDPLAPLWIPKFASHWITWVAYGLLATLPLLVMLVVFELVRWQPVRRFRQTYIPLLQLMFGRMSLLGLALVAVAAGIGEELLFRWSIQGGLAAHLADYGPWAAVAAVVIASLLFGFAHFLSWTYMIWATAVGIYFGVIFQLTGNWLVPAFAHGLYDFIALVYLTRCVGPAVGLDQKNEAVTQPRELSS